MSISRNALPVVLAAMAALAFPAAFAQSIPDPSSPASDAERGPTPTTHEPDATRNKPIDKGAMAGGLSDKDANFIKDVASIGLMEVEAGKLANDRGASPKVKEFADAMVKDHSKNNDELRLVAENKGVTLPAAPEGKPKTELDALKTKRGADFDQAYADANVKGHEDAIARFEKAAKSSDAQVRAFAERTLPTLKHHLEMAQAMQLAVNGGKPSKSKKEKVPVTDTSGG